MIFARRQHLDLVDFAHARGELGDMLRRVRPQRHAVRVVGREECGIGEIRVALDELEAHVVVEDGDEEIAAKVFGRAQRGLDRIFVDERRADAELGGESVTPTRARAA